MARSGGWLSQTRPIPRSPDGDKDEEAKNIADEVILIFRLVLCGLRERLILFDNALSILVNHMSATEFLCDG